MIAHDSTGGTSHGSGNPPVFHFKSFIDRLGAIGYSVESDMLTSYLIESVGYQTLTSYFSFFERIALQDHMKSLGTVNDVLDFDNQARILLLKAIGIIEQQLKAQFQAAMYEVGGTYCLYDPTLFRRENERVAALNSLRVEANRQSRNNAGVRRSFKSGESRLPIWTAMDVASLGTVRRMYSNTRNAEVVHRVAESFGVNHRCLHSWLRTLTLVRNCCAHFNPYVVRPQIPAVPKPVYGVEGDNAKPLYALSLVDKLLNGRAEVAGGLAVGDCEWFRQEASNLVGSLAWRYPSLAAPLGLPIDLVDEYADPRLPAVHLTREPRTLRYRLAPLTA
ncbi:MAG: Abi family protein [Eggerthellaceae bacterium]|nr:Abi family protein [Eggerthellaceae bacterium]